MGLDLKAHCTTKVRVQEVDFRNEVVTRLLLSALFYNHDMTRTAPLLFTMTSWSETRLFFFIQRLEVGPQFSEPQIFVVVHEFRNSWIVNYSQGCQWEEKYLLKRRHLYPYYHEHYLHDYWSWYWVSHISCFSICRQFFWRCSTQ